MWIFTVSKSKNISNYLTANFSAAKSYITLHRNGTDVGMFISNGVDRILRFGPDRKPELVLSGPGIVGLAFASAHTAIVATNSALYRVEMAP